jgi:AraC family transcriptional regulator of adaptative response/methylated-DNA-[protein]-cysteine methyltransferase
MDFQEQYDALLRSDPAYEGRFFVGVKTTGVFCRPTCRARKPKAENCEFYPSTDEAARAGYRPCKLCHPLELNEPVPALIGELLRDLASRPGERIGDDQLRRRGLDPGTVRRWFQRHHGLTFQGFQRTRRLGAALQRLQHGETVVSAAFGSGFGSLSAFGDSFKKTFGSAPRDAKTGVLWVAPVSTPLGGMVAAAHDGGLCALEFADRTGLDDELAGLAHRLGIRLAAGHDAVFDRLSEQLERYFAGSLRQFDLPLNPLGTDFQREVWTGLLAIPYGQTRSYREQAVRLGRPDAVRAVGTADGANRLCIVFPCHRVVGSDGALSGYRGGLHRKRWLLDFEAGRPGAAS